MAIETAKAFSESIGFREWPFGGKLPLRRGIDPAIIAT
jgi:hypothetical protein